MKTALGARGLLLELLLLFREFLLLLFELGFFRFEVFRVLPILLLLAVIAVLLTIVIQERNFEKNAITRSSVKESLDWLNTGLCFAYKNGMVMLINHRMNNLSHTIFGIDLQNANAFWERLKDGEIQAGVARLVMGENPTFRLPDQTVWTFAREEIEGITQLTAAETTRLHQLTEELKEKNAELSVMNERLRKYGENVDKLTREKERLETKARIHRELGQALLLTRRYLQSESENTKDLLNVLKRNIAMLRLESESPKNDEPLAFLLAATLCPLFFALWSISCCHFCNTLFSISISLTKRVVSIFSPPFIYYCNTTRIPEIFPLGCS